MKICIPVREKSTARAALQIKKAQKEADFVEIWLDKIESEKAALLIKICKKPVIVVCRGLREQGSFKGSEKERIERLIKAVEAGAQFVDCGVQTSLNLIKKLKTATRRAGAKLIISEHFWKGTPSLGQLEKKVAKAKRMGADIVKIATTVKNWSDNVVLFELTARAAARGGGGYCCGDGRAGKNFSHRLCAAGRIFDLHCT